MADFPLDALPGHYIRRLQQIAVAVFLEETAEFGITPVQFAALQAVRQQPGLDQRSLARTIGYDTSTIGGVVDRLEKRGLLQRQASPSDRRVRQLVLTTEGERVLMLIIAPMQRAQHRMLAPLPPDQRDEFLRMLVALVQGNNELARAPGELG
ncbi:MarR family winged helix-turn-helix transcriptional regulator [Ideonella aquatica]|uniref:MarR family winged helix-turn-helix transcriptional regulator n=1 Tax=Ideonella aquatica TaxID=2824119 RepID=UPI0028734AB4|nr:MarR family transcriptional regulator [Ideonella aquatica]